MVHAVTFDLWDTLLLSSAEYNQNIQKKRIELMHTALDGVSRDYIAQALEKSWREIENIRMTLRDVSIFNQIEVLKKYLPNNIDTHIFEKMYTEAVLHIPPRINPFIHQVLSDIPIKIGLISNTGRTPGKVLRSLLSNIGILHFFDVCVFSNEVGYLKPHPHIFAHAARILEVPVSTIVHVGDDNTADINGAHALGMKTVLIKKCADILQVKEVVL